MCHSSSYSNYIYHAYATGTVQHKDSEEITEGFVVNDIGYIRMLYWKPDWKVAPNAMAVLWDMKLYMAVININMGIPQPFAEAHTLPCLPAGEQHITQHRAIENLCRGQ